MSLSRRQFLACLGIAAAVPATLQKASHLAKPENSYVPGEWHMVGVDMDVPHELYRDPARFAECYIDPAMTCLAEAIETRAAGRRVQFITPELPKGIEYAGIRHLGTMPVIRELRAYDPIGDTEAGREPGWIHRLDVQFRIL